MKRTDVFNILIKVLDNGRVEQIPKGRVVWFKKIIQFNYDNKIGFSSFYWKGVTTWRTSPEKVGIKSMISKGTLNQSSKQNWVNHFIHTQLRLGDECWKEFIG